MIKKSALNIAYFLGSMAILIGIWQLISIITKAEIPSPVSTWTVFKELMVEPFYDRGPNDKGIGNNLMSSIGRVFTGFLLGSIIAIP
ncbi:MAG: hypothetical protein V4585_08900, partial [Bacteroidota bacterium]